MMRSLTDSVRRVSTVHPRYNEIALFEFSLYLKFFAVATAVQGQQIICTFNEVLLITKSVSCPESSVIMRVYCICICNYWPKQEWPNRLT